MVSIGISRSATPGWTKASRVSTGRVDNSLVDEWKLAWSRAGGGQCCGGYSRFHGTVGTTVSPVAYDMIAIDVSGCAAPWSAKTSSSCARSMGYSLNNT